MNFKYLHIAAFFIAHLLTLIGCAPLYFHYWSGFIKSPSWAGALQTGDDDRPPPTRRAPCRPAASPSTTQWPPGRVREA